jgi:LPXTG-site transpeptidase (sortase) family protein
MKHSRNSQQIQGDFQDFEAPAPAEPEYAGEVTMALPPVPMPDPNARRGLAQPTAKRSVLWSVLGILGEVLMTLAAVCALYVVWQMWWTGVQSEHTQVETRQSASWSDPAGGDSSKVAKAQSGDVPVQPTSASDGELIAQVYVPRFGQGWVRNVVEGTDEAELSLHGLGHYPSTQMPGSVGNFAVAGHRNGYGRPLGDVDLLQEGDAIIVRTKDYWYVYKYTTYKIVTPEHSEVIAANPEDLNTPPSKRMITLTTCEPKYTTATHRWISYGELSYWAKVSDGVPQELATSSNSAKVAFSSSNTSQSFVSKLGTLQPIVLWALVAYLVLYIAALVAWRYPVLREIRAGKRRRPDASIYGWLLRHQPGPLVIRWALLILLLFIVSVVLIQWACPWAASNIPILQSMSNYAVD